MGALVVASWWATANELPLPSRRIGQGIVAATNLKMIYVTWSIQQNDDRAPTIFDTARARHDMRPAYSAVSEYAVGRFKAAVTKWYQSGFVYVHLIPFSLYLIAISILWRGRPRRVALAAMFFTCPVLADAMLHNIFIDTILPGSYKFLDDYVYLSNVDLNSATPERGTMIVAYERKPTSRLGKRIVGFADGHVESVWEEKLVPMLRAQGHELAPDDAQLNNP